MYQERTLHVSLNYLVIHLIMSAMASRWLLVCVIIEVVNYSSQNRYRPEGSVRDLNLIFIVCSLCNLCWLWPSSQISDYEVVIVLQ